MKRLAMRRTLGGLAAGAAMMTLGIMAGGAGPMDVAASAPAAPTQPARTMPAGPTANVTLVDWSVFLVEVPLPQMNAIDLFGNTLPAFVNDARKPAEGRADGKMACAPIGMIRLAPAGPVNSDMAMDVQLSYKDGRVLGRWPAGKSRSDGVLWQDIHFAGEKDALRELPEGSWLAQARVGAEHKVMVGAVAETFLLYDLQVTCPVNLRVATGDKGAYKVAQGGDGPLLNLTFYKHDGNGWRTATLARLDRTKSGAATSPAPATAPPATRSRVTAAAASAPAPQPGTAPSPTRSSVIVSALRESAPPAAKAPEPLIGATDVALGAESADEAQALESWRPVLAEAGVSAGDQEMILKILGQYALDPKRLTAVYRMDSTELEKVLPLEVVPQPKKISRIALVVVTGIDPAMGQEVDELIAQLGNASWEKREAAMKQIRKLGVRAKQPLERATQDKDMEIKYRAEQLLQILAAENGPPEPTPPPQ